ncbi:hypothetical protein [Pararobbsia alpina]|uniref:hypothetical protein n=1 Tax=Pararobbsia alpina TaxID=621374 RepID=UPI0039A50A3A
MKTRSSIEIFAPAAIVLGLCVFSVPTFVVAVIWMTAGVCAVGYRTLEEFPTAGISWRWIRGWRRGITHFYHLACWPRYVGGEVRARGLSLVTRIHSKPLRLPVASRNRAMSKQNNNQH